MDDKEPRPFAWNFCSICGRKLEEYHDGERIRPYCRVCRRHYYQNPVPASCIFIRDGAGRILFGKRAVQPCIGQWALPGGFMELDESGEECALREMLEETGLTGTGARLLGVRTSRSMDKGSVLVLGYVIEGYEGTLLADSDVSDLRFFGREERPAVPFEAHRALLALYDSQYP